MVFHAPLKQISAGLPIFGFLTIQQKLESFWFAQRQTLALHCLETNAWMVLLIIFLMP